MKKIGFSIFILSIVLFSCVRDKSIQEQDSTTADKVLSNTFYQRLEGTLGKEPLILHLQGNPQKMEGSMYSNGAWINLYADTLKQDGPIKFSTYNMTSNTGEDPTIEIVLTKIRGGYEGKWMDISNKTEMPIRVKEKYPAGSTKITAYLSKDSARAENKEGSPSAEVSYGYLESSDAFLNAEIKKIFDPKATDAGSIKQLISKLAAQYLSGYQKEIQDFLGKDPQPGMWMNYYQNERLFILYNDLNYVVINHFTDGYTGGAHGYHNSNMIALDLEQKKVLQLKDIVQIDSNNLQQLIEKNFRKQNKMAATDPLSNLLFENQIKPNNNFLFNNNGLAFIYNPYEIASYAQGQIMIFIPWTDLDAYLLPAFKSRMRKDLPQ